MNIGIYLSISVVIVEESLLEGIIPKEILKKLRKYFMWKFRKFTQDIQEQISSKLGCIPFSSLGKENGMLVGIKISEIVVKSEDEEKKNS